MEINYFICNKCGGALSSSESPFYITNCSHIFCRECLVKGGKTCGRCNLEDIESFVLTQGFCQSVRTCMSTFLGPLEGSQFGTALKFHLEQHQVLADRFEELDKKFEASKKSYWKLYKETEKLSEELAKEREEKLKENDEEFRVVIPDPPSTFLNFPPGNGRRRQITPVLAKRLREDKPKNSVEENSKPSRGVGKFRAPTSIIVPR